MKSEGCGPPNLTSLSLERVFRAALKIAWYAYLPDDMNTTRTVGQGLASDAVSMSYLRKLSLERIFRAALKKDLHGRI